MAGNLAIYDPVSFRLIHEAAIGSSWNCHGCSFDGLSFLVGTSFYIVRLDFDDSGAVQQIENKSMRTVSNAIQEVYGIVKNGKDIYFSFWWRTGTPPGPFISGYTVDHITEEWESLGAVSGFGVGALGTEWKDITYDDCHLWGVGDPEDDGTDDIRMVDESSEKVIQTFSLSHITRCFAWNGRGFFRVRSNALLPDLLSEIDVDGNEISKGVNFGVKQSTGMDFGFFDRQHIPAFLNGNPGPYIFIVWN